jgi:peptidoglycan hydrolase-like protein with peptidoglycan-binding domain
VPLIEDGSFGRQTRAGVRLFQTLHDLHPDGDPGPLTRTALHDALETASK